MEFKIDSNPTLTVVSLDEKWANVTCEVCGMTEKVRRTEIYKLNRNKIQVACGYCKYHEALKEAEEIN